MIRTEVIAVEDNWKSRRQCAQARERDAPRNGSAAWRGDTTSAWTAAESRDADGQRWTGALFFPENSDL